MPSHKIMNNHSFQPHTGNPKLDERVRAGARELRKTHLTRDEKRAMLSRVFDRTSPSATGKTASWWSVTSIALWTTSGFKSAVGFIPRQQRFTYAFVAAVLILICSGTGVAFAAQGSVPGDILYPVKIDVTEPLQEALAFSPAAKAALAVSFANERLQEGEMLAKTGQLNSAKEQQLSDLLAQHTAALNTALASIVKTNPSQAQNISAQFQANMDAHAQILNQLDAIARSHGHAFGLQIHEQINAQQNTNQSAATSSQANTASTTVEVSNPGPGKDHGHQQIFHASINQPQEKIPSFISARIASSASTTTSAQNSASENSYQPQHNNQNFNQNDSQNNGQNSSNGDPISNLVHSAQQSGASVTDWIHPGKGQDNGNAVGHAQQHGVNLGGL